MRGRGFVIRETMSCNGCRVLRKGCSESCILRPCLQWIESAESQAHATIFVAKFFGRAGLMSFISAVPESQRPSLFESLLFEACGRTVNPVNGAVGLLWTGNWHMCQAAVETVLRGGTLRASPEVFAGGACRYPSDEASDMDCTDTWKLRDPKFSSLLSNSRNTLSPNSKLLEGLTNPSSSRSDLDPSRTPIVPAKSLERRRPGSPSMNSEESVTTTCFQSSVVCDQYTQGGTRKLLNLFI